MAKIKPLFNQHEEVWYIALNEKEPLKARITSIIDDGESMVQYSIVTSNDMKIKVLFEIEARKRLFRSYEEAEEGLIALKLRHVNKAIEEFKIQRSEYLKAEENLKSILNTFGITDEKVIKKIIKNPDIVFMSL